VANPFLSYDCALLPLRFQRQSFVFNGLQPLFQNTGGGGGYPPVFVPDPNSVPGFDTNQTDLQCAAATWQMIAYDLIVRKMNVKAAVDDANSNVVANCPVINGVKQPNFMVLGNSKVILVK
jgi:hypothetical protein